MKRFTTLYCELDQTTRTNEKVAALEKYFRETPPDDAPIRSAGITPAAAVDRGGEGN